ncbi:MAG: Na+/galactose cotransporter, partial [Candidatus Raymondbacteria bacterium RifOxyB12_full_50_8]
MLSGKRLPVWITGLAFISANLGALEVMGMAASGAKYGMLTSHFYWVGAIPAMVFVGIFMMPFYYGSRARSVPEYLKLRFDEKTRAFNALSFAVMTVLASGISMYALALVFQLMLGWSIHVSIFMSAIVVLLYIFLGGLTSSIYNEVLQFFLIVLGFLPLCILGVYQAGGWPALAARMEQALPGGIHAWSNLGNAANNPMGIEWFGMVMGLGFVLSFGYWCTDFLVVQRALAAKDMNSAMRTPIIAAFPKAVFPFIVILPGIIAIALLPRELFLSNGEMDYNRIMPVMLNYYFPNGMLGVGLTALLASFMSGMAGNVTAFNTVWTYDIYQAYINKKATDQQLLWMGRGATVAGVLISIGTAYIALGFKNIMDYLQLLFSFFNAPLFATFLLGMFWKRTTGHGAFWGLVCGTTAAGIHHVLTKIGVIHYYSAMASGFYQAIYAWTTAFIITIIISFVTKPRPQEELAGLVYSLTPKPRNDTLAWYKRPALLGV